MTEAMRKVKASNDAIFADIYLLGAAVEKGLVDDDVKRRYEENIAYATEVLISFSCWKITSQYLRPGFSLPGSGLEQEDFLAARAGDVVKMLEILGYLLKGDKSGGKTTRFFDLFTRLSALKKDPSLQAIDNVVNWAHQSGKLFTGVSGYHAPLTPEFAEILCSSPTREDLKPYATPDSRAVIEKIFG